MALQEKKADKNGRDPWADSAAKLPAVELPAHIRKQLEDALSEQVADASAEFETVSQAATEIARTQFMESVQKIASDFSSRNESTYR